MTAGRRLAVVLAALAGSAFGLWWATRLVWVRAEYHSELRGALSVPFTGGELHPALGALAVVALAAGAAVFALHGWARRLLGVVVVLAAAWAVWLSVSPAAPPPPGTSSGDSGNPTTSTGHPPADAIPIGGPARTAAPVLGVASGLLLGVAGVGLLGWANALPRMGSRYVAPGSARRAPDRDTQWWRALDAGEDPTLLDPAEQHDKRDDVRYHDSHSERSGKRSRP